MKKFALSLIVALSALVVSSASYAQTPTPAEPNTDVAALKASSNYPGTVGDWFGYESHDFQFQGRGAKLVFPKEQAEGKPWVWRARFFGHEPQYDLAMLERGYTLAYVDSAPLMGSPKSVALWQEFYLYLTSEFELSAKPNLEGMSRGGLYTTNWAFQYPDEVSSIYIDNPVLDFKSWPGAFGKGGRSDGDWADVLASYGFTEEEALAYKGNPVDNKEGCEKLAKRGVGILLVCGDSDHYVPGDENYEPFMKLYRSVGGPVDLILKPGNDHHPHSLKDPTPIVEFTLKFDKSKDK